MCGIAGYVDFSSKTGPSVIKKMTDVIAYRGPDSAGKFVSKNNTGVLGIRRLRIIDLATGDQPIKNEDGSVVVVFNGEIYGYQHLRSELLRKGHKLRTKSDTEVLVHLYEEYGEEMVKMLNGMFAFAIWDEKKQKLLIARDRSGIKPLYYAYFNGIFAFGSEPKTILLHPKFSKKINSRSVSTYLYFGYLPGDSSMYEGVYKLLPGHYQTVTKTTRKITKYFSLDFTTDVSDLDSLLDRAVTDQLVADVPVGVFLSGGLDSSLICHYITKHKRKMKSFSISFDESSFDESQYANAVAKKLGTEHYSDTFTTKDVVDIFSTISKNMDEPLADGSLLPTFKVSQLARKYVTVALSGDGGDELFGGYPTHQAHIIADRLRFLPDSYFDVGIRLLQLLPTSFENYPIKHLGTTFLEGIKKEPTERQLYWMRTFFLTNKFLVNKPSLKSIKKALPSNQKLDSVKQAQLTDFFTYMIDDFLIKTDRASMFNSLEVRVPYLDNSVVNYAFAQKSSAHVDLFETKKLLRKLARKYLPQDVANRPKKGFGIPMGKWLREDLKSFGRAVLANDKLYAYVDKKVVDDLWSQHQLQKQNNSGVLWLLISFSGWLTNWS